MPRPKQAILEYRTYSLPPDFPIIALTGEQWHISPVPSPRLHIHNCLEIGLCHTDSGSMLLGTKQVEFQAGTVTCIARNVPHTTWSSPGESSRWSYLFLDPYPLMGDLLSSRTGPTFAESCQRMLTDGQFVLSPAESPWALPLIETILEEMQGRKPGYQACVCSLLMTLFIRLHRLYSETTPLLPSDSLTNLRSFSAVSDAVEYMHAHFEQPIAMEDLAAMCHLSPSHFRRLFSQHMGASPLRFLHQLRIVESCRLLRSTNLSIAEIATRVGYPSLSSFNQHFREIMDSAPSHWRKSGEDFAPTLQSYEGWLEAE